MRFRYSNKLPAFPHYLHPDHHQHQWRQFVTSFVKKAQASSRARASFSSGSANNSQGNTFLVPGATVATLLMLGALHARRLYDDKKVEEAREKGIEVEFKPDVKVICLCYIFDNATSTFHFKVLGFLDKHYLEEAALPLEEYTSLREFFVRTLKQGSRPIDHDPHCLVSPVDGIILRFGELKGAGAMIEQVKGFSYSVSSLLGASSFLPMIAEGDVHEEREDSAVIENTKKSWWRISLASPKVRDTVSSCPMKGLYYCVIYLKPGDYHRIHSPVDWNVLGRRHFSGRLFPVNERATKTIRNLYVENERVVLEGLWQEGFMAIAAIGATNIGSIELFIEPELRTNRPRKRLLHSESPEERVYEPEGVGVMLKKGDEVAAFNMGSTVVLVFQAPSLKSLEREDTTSEFRFSIGRGDKIRVGEALGKWQNTGSKSSSS
ncbi:hypothetical protein EZV62_023688 [Acer yangbiense]|uniref:phosphatidylserine decarboxylase n=1 Tax=Acer yangbiense TaxID=1000413 RepID=A0A5C7H2C9_9ROSI|nr:hypothetical protein EZV62_023688 [Acer yangbiense]